MSNSTKSAVPPVKVVDREVPALALGTWAWGDKRMWDYKPEDFQTVQDAWKTSLNLGLTFFDTAEIYGSGENERIMGRLIAETDAAAREKLFIATKFLPYPGPMSFFLFTPPLVNNLRKSLERLGTDSVDLYQVHSAGLYSFKSYADGLAECHKLGLAKAVGVSNLSTAEMIKMYDLLQERGVQLASNQVEFSLLRKRPETTGLIEEAKKRGIAILAYSPLGMGRLTGKYSASNPPPAKRHFAGAYTWEQLDPLIAELKSVAEKYSVTPAAVALNWVICKGAIPLGGARTPEQARANAQALTFMMTEEEVQKLGKLGFGGTS